MLVAAAMAVLAGCSTPGEVVPLDLPSTTATSEPPATTPPASPPPQTPAPATATPTMAPPTMAPSPTAPATTAPTTTTPATAASESPASAVVPGPLDATTGQQVINALDAVVTASLSSGITAAGMTPQLQAAFDATYTDDHAPAASSQLATDLALLPPEVWSPTPQPRTITVEAVTEATPTCLVAMTTIDPAGWFAAPAQVSPATTVKLVTAPPTDANPYGWEIAMMTPLFEGDTAPTC